ncbi:MAG: aminotransferase class IV [Yoonia sp.]|nr:aminotransferase class IV [Yoonia sp.]
MESTFRDTCPDDLRVIETFGAGPDGMPRWPAHRARLIATCARLGIAPDLEIVDAAVAVLDMSVPLRVRLTVDLSGGLNVMAVPAGATPDQWRIGLADQMVDADDPWFAVKTTHRALYDSARAALPTGLDEVIFVNQAGFVSEGTITNVFVQRDGILLTPPLSDGVLSGVLRASLLADSRAIEAQLRWADVVAAEAVFVGNSLRGLIRAVV